jgi:hypothetical protein
MRRSNEQSIKEVISELFESNHMKGKLAEVDVINNWEKIVGPMIAKQTEKIYFYKGKLFIHITSPPLRHELNYTRSKIVEVVNQFVGQEIIEDVVVR